MRRFTALVITALLLAGSVTAFAKEAGGPDDPLVSRSFAQSWAEELVKEASGKISKTLSPVYDAAVSHAQENTAPKITASKRTVYPDGTVTLSSGASLTLLSGAAGVRIEKGSLVNVSVGAEASNGKVNPGQKYIACENTTAVVTASSESVFLLDGNCKVSAGKIQFFDVRSGDWFCSYVYFACDAGLINGFGDGSFRPASSLTVAQAIKLAACMHKRVLGEEVEFAKSDPWYKVYVDYAVSEKIIESSYAQLSEKAYNSDISRREYAHIFYGALDPDGYSEISSVPDGSVPDLRMDEQYAAEIYTMYRAGILTGSSGDGIAEYSFLPDKEIVRSEVSAVVARMVDSAQRVSIDLS